jgi:hypothetical protein
MIQVVWVIAAGIAAGALYRLGGTSKGTKWRDLGCPVIVTVLLLALGVKAPWWAYLAQFGLLFGALTAYWGLDEKTWGFWAHGLGLSLAALPIAYASGHWAGFIIRCIVLTGFIAIWSEYIKWDTLEEFGRGFILSISIPLLFL